MLKLIPAEEYPTTELNFYLSNLYPLSMERVENTIYFCTLEVSVETFLFVKSLLSDGSCKFAHFAVIAQKRFYVLQYI
jgi:hypothetical protein